VTDALQAAHSYIRRGWGVTPIYGINNGACMCDLGAACSSAGKHPRGRKNGWRHFQGGADVQAWYEDNPGDNVGIVTGPESGIFAVDVDGQAGIASITDLAREHGPMPTTRIVRTGSGGLHYVLNHPSHFVIHNSTSYIGKNIDIRGKGGMIVAPPSVSGTGPYEVLADVDIADAPKWLLTLLHEHTTRLEHGQKAEIRVAEHVDVELLPERVATLARQHVGMDEGRFKHFHALVAACYEAGFTQGQAVTITAPWCAAVGKFVGRVEQEVARTWGKLEAESQRANEWIDGLGDRPTLPSDGIEHSRTSAIDAPSGPDAASTRHETAGVPPTPDAEAPDLPASWAPIDPGPILDGTYQPPLAQLFPRNDGHCLLYRGLVHSFHGESESGKSLIAQGEVARVLTDGGTAAYIDFESDATSVYGRLRDMAAPENALRTRFTYRRPDTDPFSMPGEREAFARLLADPLDLVIIDGVTDALSVFGASSNDMDEVTNVMRRFMRRVAQRTGAAVVMIDHVTKDADTRGRHAVGSQAKLNGLDGAAYVIEVAEVLGQDLRGAVTMRVGKDRPGGVRPHAGAWRKTDRTQLAATVIVDSTGDGIHITVEAPDVEAVAGGGPDRFDKAKARLTGVMEALSNHMQNSPGPLSKTNVDTWGTVRGDKRGEARAALDELILRGNVQASPQKRGGVNLWELKRPFSVLSEWVENAEKVVYTSTPPDPAVTPPAGSETTSPTTPPNHPPYEVVGVVVGGGVDGASGEVTPPKTTGRVGNGIREVACKGCYRPTLETIADAFDGRCATCAREAGLL
jgi:bifunctional DNA primase/polymerase-like protein/AAA domain-containing protein